MTSKENSLDDLKNLLKALIGCGYDRDCKAVIRDNLQKTLDFLESKECNYPESEKQRGIEILKEGIKQINDSFPPLRFPPKYPAPKFFNLDKTMLS